MSSAIAYVTTFWGLLMGLAPLLQVRVILRERSSEGISAGWVMILLVGFLLWLAYGFVNRDVPLIITNVVAVSVTATLLVTMRRYRPPA